MSDIDGLPRVEYEDIEAGQGTLNKDLKEKVSTKKGIVFQYGDILYGKLRPYLKNWLFAWFSGIAVGDFWVLRSNLVSHSFIYRLVQTPAFDYIANQSTGSKMPRADWNLVSNSEFTLPLSTEEQEAIGQIFLKLDNLITLHQRKQNDLFLLILGKKSSSILANDWEQRKFESLAKTRRGLTYNPSHISSHGIRVLRSSNINEDTFVLSDEDVFVCQNAVKIECVKPNDILITAANGSTRLVGKHAIIVGIRENEAVHGGFMLVASSSKPFFLNAAMSAPWYLKFINLFVAGGNGAIGNLNKNDLDNQVLLVPKNDEQDKIGAFFRNLDNLVTLHQRGENIYKRR